MKLVRSVKLAVLDAEGEMLVLRRSATHPRAAFEADLPGGVVGPDETIEEGALRELHEETGLVVQLKDLKLLYTFTHDFPGVSVNRLLYAVKFPDIQPAITLSYEHDQYSWQPVDSVTGVEGPYQKGIDYANEHHLWGEI